MSILEVTTRVTYKYLMGKRKDDLSRWILELLEEVERLRTFEVMVMGDKK